MDKWRCMQVFIEVARGLSFSAAADRLGLARSNVSKQVVWLEQHLGAQLLVRTTKNVSLTEAGLLFFEHAQAMFDEMEQLEELVGTAVKEPRGIVRIGVPPSFGTFHLVPVIHAFSHQHPDIQVVMQHDDGRGNLIADGMDMSIRISASLKDSSLSMRHITTAPQVLVAAPRYFERRARPQTPSDLADHDCMVHALKSPTSVWVLHGPTGRQAVRVKGTIRANFGEPLHYAALLGQGISMHPTYMVAEDLRRGALEIVLPAFKAPGLDVHAVFTNRRNMPSRVRAFIDFLKDWFSEHRWREPSDLLEHSR